MTLTSEDLLKLGRRGLIPGPKEDEEQFLERIELTLKRSSEEEIPEEDWEEALHITAQLYGVEPDWIPAFYSDKGLRPWEGAAIWMDKRSSKIQLRTAFRKGSFLKIYKRAEVLSHEAVHAARFAFNEPRFEEIFAYKTSSKTWRKILGPLFRTPLETGLFLLALIASAVLPFLFFLPWLLLLIFGVRLFLSHRTLSCAQQKCEKILLNPAQSLCVLLRLTDKEICFFSKASTQEINAYIFEQTTLRWHSIKSSFVFRK